jgi:endonuclease-3
MIESICSSPEDEIADTIYPCGPHHQKAGFIKNWCQFVRDEFQTTEQLESFIERHPPDQARETLTHPSGVGRKTVDVVLTFTVGKDGVFAVDTHVHRVAKRLALVPESASRNMTADILEQKVKPSMCGFGHTTMIEHGREVCKARNPRCDECFIEDDCPQIGVDH